MQLSGSAFIIGTILVVSVPIAVVWLNSWRPKAGWWFLTAIAGFIVVGNAIEKLTTSSPPQRLMGEMDRTSTILRDLLNANFNSIHVNDPVVFEDVKQYIRSIAPEQENIVKLYRGKLPIFEQFGIDKQIKSSFGKTVNMPNGAYIIVEHTEALHVIDINSGVRFQNSDSNQEANALQVNLTGRACLSTNRQSAATLR